MLEQGEFSKESTSLLPVKTASMQVAQLLRRISPKLRCLESEAEIFQSILRCRISRDFPDVGTCRNTIPGSHLPRFGSVEDGIADEERPWFRGHRRHSLTQGAVDVLRVTRCQHEVELGMSKNLLSIRCIELFLNNVLIF